MQQLNDAYAVLSNPERRAEYDRSRRERTRTKSDGETQTRRGHSARREAHAARARSERRQQAPPTPPRTPGRSRGVLSEWFGVLFVIAFVALVASETLQQMVDDAWSSVADMVAALPVSRGSDPDATTQPVRQAPAGRSTSRERPSRGQSTAGPSARLGQDVSRNDARRIAPPDLTRGSRSATGQPTPRPTTPTGVPSSAEPSTPRAPTATPSSGGRPALSARERSRIQRICDAEGIVRGAAAHARCVEDWRRHRPDFGGMSVSERSRIRRICEGEGIVSGAAAYARCVEDWRRHRPDFSGMSVSERSRIQRICETQGIVSGAAAYARCVEDWIESR